MKAKIEFILILCVLSALTAGFGTMPTTMAQFAGAFAIALVFWICMLAPVILFNKLE